MHYLHGVPESCNKFVHPYHKWIIQYKHWLRWQTKITRRLSNAFTELHSPRICGPARGHHPKRVELPSHTAQPLFVLVPVLAQEFQVKLPPAHADQKQKLPELHQPACIPRCPHPAWGKPGDGHAALHSTPACRESQAASLRQGTSKGPAIMLRKPARGPLG